MLVYCSQTIQFINIVIDFKKSRRIIFVQPFPLYDPNLSEVHALQRCQEDNFLFSHEQDLGRIEKVVLWYDKWPRFSSWLVYQGWN